MSTRRRTTTNGTRNPQLGELTFDDWYQTPVFEAEPDERIEQLATSRRAPMRLVGAAMLRLAPDRPQQDRPQQDRPQQDRPQQERPQGGPIPASGSWRGRAGQFLDRWAEMEAASQKRLEGLVLPRRWRG